MIEKAEDMPRPAWLLYLAGPMRSHPLFNFPAFYRAQNELLAVGYRVISPAEMDHVVGFNEYLDVPDMAFIANAMRRDFMAIDVCDGVALLPGWRKSVGTRRETDYARSLKIPCREVKTWLKRRAPTRRRRTGAGR